METSSLTATGSIIHPPVISMKSSTVVPQFAAACSTWGALVLTDHGLDPEMLQRVLATGHAFFDLPQDIKDGYSLQQYGSKWRGYMRLGGERSVRGELEDTKEGLYMGDEHPAEHPRLGLPTFGANVFPVEVAGMSKLFLDYNAQMKQLGNRIMQILSQALELPSDYIEEHVTRHEPVILPRMFRYPPQQANRPGEAASTELKSGIGRHSDYGLWTMILSDAPGLEFQHLKTDAWHPVPHIPGSLIMNVGDVLDRLTSGRFISAYHRARNLSFEHPRLSLPFFYDPAWTAKMQTFPTKGAASASPSQTTLERWANTKITCEFDGTVEYSEFLAKKVAKVFPDLVPEECWKQLSSTSEPSTRHALVVRSPDARYTPTVVQLAHKFYAAHPEIKPSHGWAHVEAVYNHAAKACSSRHPNTPPLTCQDCMEVKVAALLHDMDDRKYFPHNKGCENARAIMAEAGLTDAAAVERVVEMIELVSCSANGNRVPSHIAEAGAWHRLIPRWADRLEAVGPVGVVRCYRYNQVRDGR